MRYLIALCLLIVLIASTAHAAGTINLPTGPYCATTQAGSIYNGVTAGACAVIPPTVGCPATIQTLLGERGLLPVADISYGAYPAVRPRVALNSWDNLWGHNSINDAGTGWSGVGGASPVIRAFGKKNYMGLKFHTPVAAAGKSGFFTIPSFVAGPNVIMAISTTCGAFATNLPTPGCLADHQYGSPAWSGIPTADKTAISWKFSTNAPDSQCNLKPDTDYYVNVMLANDNTDCAPNALTCALGVVSYHN